MSEVIHADHHDDHAHGPAKGMLRWLYTTNHKDIGTLYLWFSFAMFLIGGVMALVIRTELFQPGLQFIEPEFFNQMTTNHGLIMVFGAIMPAFVGLANWLIPMQVGAPDMALPRMNNLSFWILPFAFSMMISTLFMEGGGPNFGWTFYAPLSTTYAPDSVTYFIFAVHLMGASSIMGSYQYHRDYLEYARSWYDLDEDANVCMDMVDYSVFVDRSNACSSWRGNHDVVRYSLQHQLL